MLQITAAAIFITGFLSELKNISPNNIIDHPFVSIFHGSCAGLAYLFFSTLACFLVPDFLDIIVPLVLLLVFYCEKYYRCPRPRNNMPQIIENISVSLLLAALVYGLAIQIPSLIK
jgi:hypothetical protein